MTARDLLRRTVAYQRPRLRALCRTDAGGWHCAWAQPQVRLENRRHITIGDETRLMVGAQIYAHGGPVSIGSASLVAHWAVVQSAGGSVTIGDRTMIGSYGNLYGQGGLTVGDDVLMASGVRIMTAEHQFDRRDIPIKAQPERVSPTTVEDGVWLAANVVILAGVTVGEGAICAAGAVVTRDVPPYSIVGGVPARVIRQRPDPPTPDDASR